MNSSTYHIFFRNLANPIRIKIISKLKDNPSSVNELSKKLNMEQSKLSHALKSLKNCNLVKFKQKGKQRIYSLNKKTIIPILKIIDKHVNVFCNCTKCNKTCEGKRK